MFLNFGASMRLVFSFLKVKSQPMLRPPASLADHNLPLNGMIIVLLTSQTGLYNTELNKDRSAHNTRPQANQLKTETRPFCTSTPAEKCTSQEQTTHQCINVPTHSRPAPSCEESDRENYIATRQPETKRWEWAKHF